MNNNDYDVSDVLAAHFVIANLEHDASLGVGIPRDYIITKFEESEIPYTDELIDEIFEWLIQLD